MRSVALSSKGIGAVPYVSLVFALSLVVACSTSVPTPVPSSKYPRTFVGEWRCQHEGVRVALDLMKSGEISTEDFFWFPLGIAYVCSSGSISRKDSILRSVAKTYLKSSELSFEQIMATAPSAYERTYWISDRPYKKIMGK